MKIISAVAGAHNGYISSMVDNVGDRYGVALVGNANKLMFVFNLLLFLVLQHFWKSVHFVGPLIPLI